VSSPVRKFFVLTRPATLVGASVLGIGVEVWVRATWNAASGPDTPLGAAIATPKVALITYLEEHGATEAGAGAGVFR
jgi:hypothetical protein